jgi:hypothetical protein
MEVGVGGFFASGLSESRVRERSLQTYAALYVHFSAAYCRERVTTVSRLRLQQFEVL